MTRRMHTTDGRFAVSAACAAAGPTIAVSGDNAVINGACSR